MKYVQLGMILCAHGVLNRDQLQRALNEQSLNPKRTLEEVLVRHGYCSQADIERCLKAQASIAKEKPTTKDAAVLLKYATERAQEVNKQLADQGYELAKLKD